MTTEVRGSRFRPASPPAAAVALGALGLVLLAAWVPLTYLTHDLQASRDGVAAALAVACGWLGVPVARRQPRNAEGWLLLGLAAGVMVVLDSGLYAVLDYRLHHGRLPLGEIAVFLKDTLGVPLILVFGLVILLFPDGRVTRRWAWVLWPYVVLVAVTAAGFAAKEAGTIAGQPIQVDVTGGYAGQGSPSGVLGVAAFATAGFFVIPLLWPAFVARQVLSWRRSAGDCRQQLK